MGKLISMRLSPAALLLTVKCAGLQPTTSAFERIINDGIMSYLESMLELGWERM